MAIKENSTQLIHPYENFVKNNIPIDKTYQYTILTPHDIDQVVDVFTTAFCRSEPMTHYLQMDHDQYRVFARAVAEKASEDQLSVVCKDGEKVAAFALVEDLAAPGPIPDFDPKFSYILALLEKLGESYFPGKKIPIGQIAHLFITAVDENYRHRGLSKQVNFRAMDLAAQHGFSYMYCELTHPFNQRGIIPHLSNPKRFIGSCLYRDFVFQGIHPFADLPGEAQSYLWAIQEKITMDF